MSKMRGENKTEIELVKIKDDLYIPADFEKYHHYFADENGEREYTGITSALKTIAKPQLIQWAANEAVKYVKDWSQEYNSVLVPVSALVLEARVKQRGQKYLVYENVLEEARTAYKKKAEKAADHGTSSHELLETFVADCIYANEGRPWNVLDGKYDPITEFVGWALENVERFIFTEKRLADPVLWIAGTCDLAYVGKDGRTYLSDFKTTKSGVYYDYWLQTAAYQYMAELDGMKFDARSIIRLSKTGEFEVRWREDYKTDLEAFRAALVLYRAQSAYKN